MITSGAKAQDSSKAERPSGYFPPAVNVLPSDLLSLSLIAHMLLSKAHSWSSAPIPVLVVLLCVSSFAVLG